MDCKLDMTGVVVGSSPLLFRRIRTAGAGGIVLLHSKHFSL